MEEHRQTNIDIIDRQNERSGIYTTSNQLVNTSYNTLDNDYSIDFN